MFWHLHLFFHLAFSMHRLSLELLLRMGPALTHAQNLCARCTAPSALAVGTHSTHLSYRQWQTCHYVHFLSVNNDKLGIEMFFYPQFNIQCQTYLTNCSWFEVHGWKTFRFRVSSWFFLMFLSHSPYIFIVKVSSVVRVKCDLTYWDRV